MARDTVDVIAEAWAAELPGVVGAELELSKRATRVAVLFSQRVDGELTRLGLTRAEYEILAVLRAAGPSYRLRPADLVQRLLISSGGTSNVLRRLATSGLIERDPNEADARSSWVRLTDRGATLAEEAVRSSSRVQASLLATVPPELAAAANAALRELLIALGDTA